MINHANAIEVNFDCLVGPTHHFGGLAFGNLASFKNKARVSNPKKAALQGLKKMQFLMKQGFVQAVLAPHERPHLKSFRNLGFLGSDEVVLRTAYKEMPQIFTSLCSSSSMWAANSATISPKSDALDNKTHLSPSNLVSMFHRSIESEFTHKILQTIFGNDRLFTVHDPLLPHDLFSDEGAANHNRLSKQHGEKGLEIFVYGKTSSQALQKTVRYPCRQSSLANQALINRHRLDQDCVLNIQQNPEAIDLGAFHNDVVCVMNENMLLCHERAFCDQAAVLKQIQERYQKLCGEKPLIMEIPDKLLPLEEAVSSYLFNAQLLTKPKQKTMALFAPTECLHNKQAALAIENILAGDNPIDEVWYFDVSESMANGGGPACLRLRVVLDEEGLLGIKQSVILNDELYNKLEYIINKYYIENLTLEHFFDNKFLTMTQNALAAIAQALGFGSIYDFQM